MNLDANISLPQKKNYQADLSIKTWGLFQKCKVYLILENRVM